MSRWPPLPGPNGPLWLDHGQADNPLRPWDAADKALLLRAPADAQHIAVLGARWGALVCGLAGRVGLVVCDSEAGRRAIASNLQTSATPPEGPAERPAPAMVHAATTPRWLRTDLDPWADADRGEGACAFDALVLRCEGGIDLLRWRLRRATALAAPGAPVLVATRDWSKGIARAVADVVGTEPLVRGVGKARLACAVVPRASNETAPPPPWRSWSGPDGARLKSLPGVFAHGHLDVGAAALLAALPATFAGLDVVDLACGAGPLGVAAAARGAKHVVFTDDSTRALASAQASWSSSLGGTDRAVATFTPADAGDQIATATADVVLCNPPFHQGRAQTAHLAEAMLQHARRILRPGGGLWLVANRHLQHERRARRFFQRVRVESDDGRFVVVSARR